jgi:hypothetical protein
MSDKYIWWIFSIFFLISCMVTLPIHAAEKSGTEYEVTAIDYLNKKIWLDYSEYKIDDKALIDSDADYKDIPLSHISVGDKVKVYFYSMKFEGKQVIARLTRTEGIKKQNARKPVAQRPLPTDEQSPAQECEWIRSEMARIQNIVEAARTTYDSNPLAPTAPMMTPSFNRGMTMGWDATAPMRKRTLIQIEALARDKIAALESRASNLKCGAAFSSTYVIENKQSSPIDDCIKACKENTSRTSEQCFDSCNR